MVFSVALRHLKNERLHVSRLPILGMCLFFDLPLDSREELRFKNTHPLTYEFILNNFDPIEVSQNPAYRIFKARGGKQ